MKSPVNLKSPEFFMRIICTHVKRGSGKLKSVFKKRPPTNLFFILQLFLLRRRGGGDSVWIQLITYSESPNNGKIPASFRETGKPITLDTCFAPGIKKAQRDPKTKKREVETRRFFPNSI